MQKRFLLVAANIFILLLAGCGYKLINPSQKSVYVEPFSNFTIQPEIDLYLVKNLKKTLAQSVGFMVVSNKKDADIIIRGMIHKFIRNPEFIAESDNLIMASYRIKVIVEIEKENQTRQKEIEQTYFLELSEKLNTQQLLEIISNRISQDIYLKLIEENEK
ncbi:MAG: LPS assembly lipoprotein LptE [Candidatus Omnitrophica bacterium]|nr:LPS assembly lipoprotein LptE [Candidatus Omnitrophota bacterium]